MLSLDCLNTAQSLQNVKHVALYLDNLESLLVAPRQGATDAMPSGEEFAAWRSPELEAIWKLACEAAQDGDHDPRVGDYMRWVVRADTLWLIWSDGRAGGGVALRSVGDSMLGRARVFDRVLEIEGLEFLDAVAAEISHAMERASSEGSQFGRYRIERRLGMSSTLRNWRTVQKLREGLAARSRRGARPELRPRS